MILHVDGAFNVHTSLTRVTSTYVLLRSRIRFHLLVSLIRHISSLFHLLDFFFDANSVNSAKSNEQCRPFMGRE